MGVLAGGARAARLGARAGAASLALVAASARVAWADIAPLDAHADDVTLDARLREVQLRGNVTVESPPFHLTSDELRLRRTPYGVDVIGDGRLAFCPCLGAPLAVRFDGVIVAPPGDLVLRQPRLEIVGAPVLWLPYFWLRTPARLGLLPPDVAYRATDGLFLGDGLHVPWRSGDAANGLDVRAGAYLTGGSAGEVALRTPSSLTRVRVDHKGGDGVTVDLRGAIERGGGEAPELAGSTLAWDADALRGQRAVLATTDIEPAARVVDRAAADAQLRDAGDGGWTFTSGVRSTSYRGGAIGDLGASGPVASASRSDALGALGAYDVTMSGGALHVDPGATLVVARGEAGAELDGRAGGLGGSLSLRAAGDVADTGDARGKDGAAGARASVGYPLVRAFASSDAADPWRHRLEPRASASVLAAHAEDVLGASIGRGLAAVSGTAWSGEVGLATALGRWGARDAVAIDGALGAVAAGVARPAARWRATSSLGWIGLGAEGAHVFGGATPGAGGSAVVARARLGPSSGIHVGVHAAGREGIDPVVARLLTDAPFEPSSGFLSAAGWTGGARVAVPWTDGLITSGGVDGDATAKELLAARGSIELRDRCRCVAVRATGSHRLARPGVDVWLTIDLAPGR